jgi:hypothetical protein
MIKFTFFTTRHSQLPFSSTLCKVGNTFGLVVRYQSVEGIYFLHRNGFNIRALLSQYNFLLNIIWTSGFNESSGFIYKHSFFVVLQPMFEHFPLLYWGFLNHTQLDPWQDSSGRITQACEIKIFFCGKRFNRWTNLILACWVRIYFPFFRIT